MTSQPCVSQCWLINGAAGARTGEALARALEPRVPVRRIDFSDLSAQLQWAAQYPRIVVAGGDGTLSAVLSHPHLPDVPVAFVPLGTANDLARELGTAAVFQRAAWGELPSLVEGLSERMLSTWELHVDSRVIPFCAYLSFGFEGGVVSDFQAWRSRSQSASRLRNRMMYSWFGVRRLGHWLDGVRVRVGNDAERQLPRSRGVICANIRSHLGCGVACVESDAGDRLLECVVASSPWHYLRMVASPLGLLPGLRSVVRGECISFRNLPLGTSLQTDGEAHAGVAGSEAQVRFRRFVRVLAKGG